MIHSAGVPPYMIEPINYDVETPLFLREVRSSLGNNCSQIIGFLRDASHGFWAASKELLDVIGGSLSKICQGG